MKRFGLLMAICAAMAGCDEQASYRAQEQRRKWAEEDEAKRLVTKCGDKPVRKKLARTEWELTLRVIGTDITFPYTERLNYEGDEIKPLPEFVFRTLVSHGDGLQETYYSEDRPKHTSDGLYELVDMKSGKREFVAPNVTISLARIEEASIDDVSADIRRQVQGFVKSMVAWQECAGVRRRNQSDFY